MAFRSIHTRSTPAVTVIGFSTATTGQGHGSQIVISGTNNLVATMTGANQQALAYINTSKTSGLWYFEMTVVYSGSANGYYPYFGLANALVSLIGWANAATYGFGFDTGSPMKIVAGSETTGYGTLTATTHTMMCAVDITNKFFYTGVNGTWNGGGVPTSGASGTGATGSFIGTTIYFIANMGSYGTGSSIVATLNSGTTTTFTLPVGYSTLT